MNSTQPECIGFVLKMFPRLSETFILNEILELENQGVAVRIFSLRRPVDAVGHAEAKLVRAPVRYVPQTLWETPGRVLRAHFTTWRRHSTGYRRALRHLVRKWRQHSTVNGWLELSQACWIIQESEGLTSLHAHFVNLPAKIALIIHRISGIPYSVTTHAKDLFLHAAITSPHVQERLEAARFVVANSQFTARHIAPHISSPHKLHAIYNGINLRSFPFRTEQANKPLILAVGRLVEKKGFAVLIAACQRLKERGVPFECELIGTGRLSEALKEQIAAAGLRESVHMIGPLAQEELRQRYAQAMVCALPCIEAADGDRDILPNVLKEAMAVGVPVVTSQLDGIEELVEHAVTGLLIAPSDSAALADCLQLLLTDPDLRQRLARQARKVIEERFDRRGNFAQLRRLFRQATASQALPASPSLAQPDIPHAHSLR